jgi:ATP-binding cassette subfamily B protein
VHSSPEFERIVSWPGVFRGRMLAGLLIGIISALLLLVGLASLAGVVSVLVSAAASTDRGLLTVAESLSRHWDACPMAGLIRRAPLLHRNTSATATLMTVAVLAFAVRWFLISTVSNLIHGHIASAVLRLRQHIHRKALRLEPADLTGEQTQGANHLFQESAQQLESSASGWALIVTSGVPELGLALIAGLATNWRVAVEAFIPVILGRMILQRELTRGDSSLRLLSEQVQRGLTAMAESLRKTRIVTAFGMESQEQKQFENQLISYRTKCRQFSRQQSVAQVLRQTLLTAIVAIPAAILGFQVLRGMMPGAAVFLGLLSLVIFRRLGDALSLGTLRAEGSERAEEIASYLNQIPSVSQVAGASFLQPMSKTLTFNQVSYQTPAAGQLLKSLDLRVTFGEKVALLSLSPDAAYALASMVPRFVDPDMGQVLIDGRDIRLATLESLRAEVLFVGGDDPVFDATVLDNITCGQPDITRQQAQEAAKMVHADHFIRTLPKGYETHLGEHGIKLDPGQIFRLSLARAAVREPAILIIEEPSISLDASTKSMLDDAYQRISVNRTVIFLPTRLSTVKRCSRVVMIHEGRVAVDGSHDQLVRSSELYKHWEYLRFNPFREPAE